MGKSIQPQRQPVLPYAVDKKLELMGASEANSNHRRNVQSSGPPLMLNLPSHRKSSIINDVQKSFCEAIISTRKNNADGAVVNNDPK
eukprot:4409420-Pyramimonas_sp.AAC.1